MIVVVDNRELVTNGYKSLFGTEGVSSAGFGVDEFRDWVESASDNDLSAVEAFLLGDFPERGAFTRLVRSRSTAPMIALAEAKALTSTLDLFAAGIDDVVAKPVHVKEILARVGAIRRREVTIDRAKTTVDEICVFADGRDAEVAGQPMVLPRRERRILEYLVANKGRRVSKQQLFSAIYGIFDENVEENVIESHISKLRKKLKMRLGYDPVSSKRYLGYGIGV
ncbi:response regulator transcription factor [Aureimonas phyllosphaerae]|uniref:DNA-binding response OmpR family regulator n=1 Tax=Aureimonas phyllosphaerae TaxID=1166078 RepID=A0A7W6BXL1_9HYPH|nr:response regulator transcription factor [Aureimonas phyllosphaerae]MBB3935561.1 DNA-binding response OmpR family regulator [Aureimonas phyllosphaerae]MBB3959569.1 DNA-binding response OmpR family regulator [Aureimonas phyllosphaerae]SFF12292.1 DNA-binding response regulator, OmpR family, contains REC and winged-helix (wHTH) domain [Aureimonas phyllosphaerae]